ncbi:hypothetical protein E0I00_05415 [Pseudomonas syringae pv. actinidiae]|nr:hypothetical protein [Pseudomonas syringae pv. actinidiae]
MSQLQCTARRRCMDRDFYFLIKAYRGNQMAIEVLKLPADSRHSRPCHRFIVMESNAPASS